MILGLEPRLSLHLITCSKMEGSSYSKFIVPEPNNPISQGIQHMWKHWELLLQKSGEISAAGFGCSFIAFGIGGCQWSIKLIYSKYCLLVKRILDQTQKSAMNGYYRNERKPTVIWFCIWNIVTVHCSGILIS